jgi:methylenetetrahydrofolate reductase (NADPH)
MAERSALKARNFANDLIACPRIDWISITDNAGGNPRLAPQALGKPILYAGKEVVIHLTCKDLNRNGLESEAWLLNSEGFHNILAMTGDYPVAGSEGLAKPVFDIDSVGLIAMLNKMNGGFRYTSSVSGKDQTLDKTRFLIGAVVTNYKLLEGEVVPQLLKLKKKIECGAGFIINQVGFDSRKMHELRVYMEQNDLGRVPLIGNVYVLNARVARIFHEKKIPGVVVSDSLLELCQKRGSASDDGRSFFRELAAKQMAIYRGLGYRGVYLGGIYNYPEIENILEIEKSFGADDWRQFAREMKFSRPGEYFCYEEDSRTGLADPLRESKRLSTPSRHVNFSYRISKWSHERIFSHGRSLSDLGAKLCKNAKDPLQGPPAMRLLEKTSKSVLFECKDCGDCSLAEIGFLCPESQCAKNQRNGPCGGTREGQCEVNGIGECIWLRAYERLKHEGREEHLLDHSPVVQNQGLRGTSAWANFWLARDHTAKTAAASLPPIAEPDPASPNSPKETFDSVSRQSAAVGEGKKQKEFVENE